MFLNDIANFNVRFVNKRQENERKRGLGLVALGGVTGAIPLSGAYAMHKGKKGLEYANQTMGKQLKDIKNKGGTDDDIRNRIRDFLGLDPDKAYDPKQVKNAYRSNSRKYHPDTGGSADKFRNLSDAYDSMKGGKYTGTKVGGIDALNAKKLENTIKHTKDVVGKLKTNRNILLGSAVVAGGIPIAAGVRTMWKNRKRKNKAEFNVFQEQDRKRKRHNGKILAGIGLTTAASMGMSDYIGGRTAGQLANYLEKTSLSEKTGDPLKDAFSSLNDFQAKRKIDSLKTQAKASKSSGLVALGAGGLLAGTGAYQMWKNRNKNKKKAKLQ